MLKVKSIFTKLMANHVITLLFAMLTTSILITLLFQSYLFAQKEEELIAKGKNIAENITPFILEYRNPAPLINLLNGADKALGTEVWLVDSKGFVIAASSQHLSCEGHILEDSEMMTILAGEIAVSKGKSQYFSESVIRVTVPIVDKKKMIGAIIVYSPLMGNMGILQQLIKLVVSVSLVVLSFAIILSYLLSRSWSKPLVAMHKGAIEMASGNFSSDIKVTSDDEIGQLGRAFNKMAEELKDHEANRRKFVADVAHELRTPITSIQGFIETLLEGKVKKEEAQKECLEIINGETKRLTRLVNQLLDLSRLDSGVVTINKEHFFLKKLTQEVLETLNPQIKAKALEIDVKIKENLNLETDRDRTYQILFNLIDNGIKFSSEEGKLYIEAEERQEFIKLKVIDEGIGMAEKDLEKIWDRFYKVDPARDRKFKGSGLGLAIVKQNAELLGGFVKVTSELGKGSQFSIYLPKQ